MSFDCNPANPEASRRVLPHETVLQATERLEDEKLDRLKFQPEGPERQTFAERQADWREWNRSNFKE